MCDFNLLSLFTHALSMLKISYFMFWLLLSTAFQTSLEGKAEVLRLVTYMFHRYGPTTSAFGRSDRGDSSLSHISNSIRLAKGHYPFPSGIIVWHSFLIVPAVTLASSPGLCAFACQPASYSSQLSSAPLTSTSGLPEFSCSLGAATISGLPSSLELLCWLFQPFLIFWW